MLSKNLIVSIFANVFQGLSMQNTFGIITVEWIPFLTKKNRGKRRKKQKQCLYYGQQSQGCAKAVQRPTETRPRPLL